MKLIEINWNPAVRQLRQFGVISLFALPALGWVWGGRGAVVGGLAAVGVVLALLGIVFPRAVKPVFLGLTLVSLPIGMVVGELAILAIFFGVFLPIGLVFRWMGRDSLERKLDRSAESYWRLKPLPKDAASYFRQS